MQIDPDEFRRHYASLSDEGLLEINRDELVEVARELYDQELAQRGLENRAEVTGIIEEWLPAATFLYPDEAILARTLLRSGGIPCYLDNEHTLSAMWPLSNALGWLRLMVSASLVEEVREILGETLSEEAAPMNRRAGRNRNLIPTMLAIFWFGLPSVDHFRIFYL